MSSPDDPTARLETALVDETAEDLYEHAPCGYLSTLPDGTIVRVNQTLLDWIGRPREALLAGCRVQALLTVGSKIYYETHHAPLLRMQGFVNEVAFELVCGDGRIMPVLVNARQRRDRHGRPLFNRITVFDATDRRRYERELLLARRKAEQIAKDKADLLGMLSHDIRNPLNALLGVVELLEGSGLTEGQQRLVRVLRSSSAHMLTLLNHVLELSRVESASFALTEKPLSVHQLVGDVLSTFEARARGKSLRLHASIDTAVPPDVIGDPVALRQILGNLVDNAVKFTARGSVEVAVTVKEPALDAVTLAFAVADTGIGIAPEVLDRVFEEFTQANDDVAVRFGGSGLGLTIARKLLSFYGSHVRVVSAPGQGSTFSFEVRLPVPRARESPQP